jgi:hypothetical protein
MKGTSRPKRAATRQGCGLRQQNATIRGQTVDELTRSDILAIVTVGIDIANNGFAIYGVDESGKAALIRSSVKRIGLFDLTVKLDNVCCWILCSNSLNSALGGVLSFALHGRVNATSLNPLLRLYD